jgi:hypothetical protein
MRLTLFLLLTLLFACNQQDDKKPSADTVIAQKDTLIKKDEPVVITNDSTVLTQLARTVLKSCKEKDFKLLSSFIHPVAGLRFSPYAYVDTTTHQRLSAPALRNLASSKQKIKWGFYDGSGDTILLNLAGYFNRFVYDKDFMAAPKRSLNKILGGGNSLNNLTKIYPGCDFMEFYFPGTDPKYGGMDWKTLRLVFKKEKDKTWLVGIIHDEWTI